MKVATPNLYRSQAPPPPVGVNWAAKIPLTIN